MSKYKTILFLTFAIIPFIFVSCKSKEEKAAELIKSELSKTLYDIDSYEPIETTVSEAKLTAYNDSTCFSLAMLIAATTDLASDAMKEAESAREHMDIWGPPTYYSSSYSDRKYREYKDKAADKAQEALTYISLVKTFGVALEDSIKNLDDKKVIGWEAKHRFRCKTRGGQYSIGDYRYIISPDFKTVLFREDMDDDDYKNARDVIEAAQEGTFSKMDSNN